MLALVAYVTFIYAGVKKSPKNFFKNSLFPSGVPWPLYIIVTPIEFISTFIIRPITLDAPTPDEHDRRAPAARALLRGDAVLPRSRSAAGGRSSASGRLAFGFAFTLFEILVAVLQAYVFALLTAVYIQLAVAEEH